MAMGQLLAARGPKPGLIVSSTAIRALATAKRHSAAFGLDDATELRLEHGLYLAGERFTRTLIAGCSADVACLMLVGHNPGLSMLASLLTRTQLSLPTGGVATIVCDSESWEEMASGTGTRLLHIDRPRDGA
jgi:phosphohistidine phosphatase